MYGKQREVSMGHALRQFQVSIKGVTPLLFNRPEEYEWDDTVKINNPNVDTDEAVKKKLYILNGVIYTPADHIRGSLVNAAKDLKVKGKGKATYSKMFGSMVQVSPEAIKHNLLEFDVHTKRGVNPSTKGMVIIRRPRLKEWELDFELIVDNEIPLAVLKEAMDRAGRYVGIGDWRPEKKGIHGKFIVSRFVEVKD